MKIKEVMFLKYTYVIQLLIKFQNKYVIYNILFSSKLCILKNISNNNNKKVIDH